MITVKTNRENINGPWSTRTSASASGRVASSRSSTPRIRITRMWRPGWGCDKPCHGVVTSHAYDKLATRLATSGSAPEEETPTQYPFLAAANSPLLNNPSAPNVCWSGSLGQDCLGPYSRRRTGKTYRHMSPDPLILPFPAAVDGKI